MCFGFVNKREKICDNNFTICVNNHVPRSRIFKYKFVIVGFIIVTYFLFVRTQIGAMVSSG